MDAKTIIKSIIALLVIGLYVIVTLTILIFTLRQPGGDVPMFFDRMSNANFLLGPVGFVIGYYFRQEERKCAT